MNIYTRSDILTVWKMTGSARANVFLAKTKLSSAFIKKGVTQLFV